MAASARLAAYFFPGFFRFIRMRVPPARASMTLGSVRVLDRARTITLLAARLRHNGEDATPQLAMNLRLR